MVFYLGSLIMKVKNYIYLMSVAAYCFFMLSEIFYHPLRMASRLDVNIEEGEHYICEVNIDEEIMEPLCRRFAMEHKEEGSIESMHIDLQGKNASTMVSKDGYLATFSVNQTEAIVDGKNVVTIILTLKDLAGESISDKTVYWQATQGILSTLSGVTQNDGSVSVELRGEEAGGAIVGAWVDKVLFTSPVIRFIGAPVLTKSYGERSRWAISGDEE